MLVIIGYSIVFISIFGGFLLEEGQIGALFQPAEFIIIIGAGFGTFIIGNDMKVIRATGKVFSRLFHTSRYNKSMYMNIMALMYKLLIQGRKLGLMALEKEIENINNSKIFSQYPSLISNKIVMEFLVDYLRLMISGNLNSYEIEALMNEEIETNNQENNIPINSLFRVGDALPAFGIVAAVMGIINALAAADRPANELGSLIANAMVGTLLGILLAYGFVMPLGELLKQKGEEHIKMLNCIKVILLSNLNGYTPFIAVEFGRKTLYSSERPSFEELENYINRIKISNLNKSNE